MKNKKTHSKGKYEPDQLFDICLSPFFNQVDSKIKSKFYPGDVSMFSRIPMKYFGSNFTSIKHIGPIIVSKNCLNLARMARKAQEDIRTEVKSKRIETCSYGNFFFSREPN